MAIRTVYADKEHGGWYIDDENGFSKEENALVAGVPEIIEALVGTRVSRVRLDYDETPFAGSLRMDLVSTDGGGSTYVALIGGRTMRGWLCPVFLW